MKAELPPNPTPEEIEAERAYIDALATAKPRGPPYDFVWEWEDGTPYEGPDAPIPPHLLEPAETIFRDELRVPDDYSVTPVGLTDPHTADFISQAGYLLNFILSVVWGPATLALQGRIWQRAKYELLDMLRPLELLLRRTLLIEAFNLITSQKLPASRPVSRQVAASVANPVADQVAGPVRNGAGAPFDPARPESWRVSFRVIPPRTLGECQRRPERKPRRKLPPVDPDHFRGDPIIPLRHREVLVEAMPLARRLEAALRVILDPAAHARRLAFRLRRKTNPRVGRLADPTPPKWWPPYARDALEEARLRLFTNYYPWWSSG